MNLWTLPETAQIGGREYAINTDYRDILDIIARLQDDQEAEVVRLQVALALFYEDFFQMPSAHWDEAVKWMEKFIGGGQEDDGRPAPKLIDWEQDSTMILADINRVAGCEVRALPHLHWWTFLSWFGGIGQGQLSTVVAIRDKRRRGKKLEKWEQEFYQEHREQIDFKKKYTQQEIEEQERLKKLLGEG